MRGCMRICEYEDVREKGISRIVVVQLDGGEVFTYHTKSSCPSLTHKHFCHTHPSPDTVSSRCFLWTSYQR